jgi:ribosomal protein S18 acetylase RimI-like enzyme
MKTPGTPSISRRAATQADMPFLLQLRRETMSPHQLASGVTASEDEHRSRVLVQFDIAQVLMLDNQPIGLLKLIQDGSNWELLQIQLSPAVQRRGIGTQLLLQIVCDAQHANATMRLSVLKANPARRLYERLGFRIVAEKPHTYEMVRAPDAG